MQVKPPPASSPPPVRVCRTVQLVQTANCSKQPAGDFRGFLEEPGPFLIDAPRPLDSTVPHTLALERRVFMRFDLKSAAFRPFPCAEAGEFRGEAFLRRPCEELLAPRGKREDLGEELLTFPVPRGISRKPRGTKTQRDPVAIGAPFQGSARPNTTA
jgi:hypothetical protein